MVTQACRAGTGPPIGHSRRLTTRDGETVEDLSWEAIPLDWQVAAPCKECNEGWMEQIETAAPPILTAMLDDKRVSLDISGVDALAQWVTLHVMVAQHAYPKEETSIDPEGALSGVLPNPSSSARCTDLGWPLQRSWPWPTQYLHREIRIARPDPSPPNAYIVGFSVGYAAFVCWGHEVTAGAIVRLGQNMHELVTPIWPALSPISWPPPGLLGAEGLATAVANLIATT